MDAAGPRNTVSGDELWDEAGRLWVRRHPAWLSARDADRWVRRGGPVALHELDGGPVRWLDAEAAAAWWQGARHHVDVPGRSATATPDASGRTWGAHVWRCGAECRVGFTALC